MWLGAHLLWSLSSLYVVLLATVVVLIQVPNVERNSQFSRLVDKQTIYAIGALLWPLIWTSVCVISKDELPWPAYLGLVWPPLLLLIDIVFVGHSFEEDTNRRSNTIHTDANVLSGLALSLGGLFVRHVSEGFSQSASPMYTAAVLLILLVVMPHPSFHAKSVQTNALQSLQKVGIQYCLGLIITSVGIMFGVGMKKRNLQTNELKKVLS